MASAYGEGKNKYSEKYTPRMASLFPSWTQVRKNRESAGQQFLNVFALEFEEIERFLNEALNNQYIGTANLGEIYMAYKAPIPVGINSSTKISSIVSNNGDTIKEAFSLRTFYQEGSPDLIIFDFEEQVCYLRNHYESVLINGEFAISGSDMYIHHIWNVFDEFGLLLDVHRRFRRSSGENGEVTEWLESNEELKERILNVFRFPANSTRVGLLRGIGQSIGLVEKEVWEANTPTYTITHENVHPETIVIGSQSIDKSQYVYNEDTGEITLSSQIQVFPRNDIRPSNTNTRVLNKKIVLESSHISGSSTLLAIFPGNVQEWKEIDIVGSGRIKVQLLELDSDNVLFEEVFNGSPIEIDRNAGYPVRVRILMSRESLADDSPEVESIQLRYRNLEKEIHFVHSIKVDAMHDNEFRRSLYNDDGFPSEELKRYEVELSNVAPIMWDRFVWDEAFWDVVDENLMGLEVLPHKWDPNIGDISNEYFQNGIGFGDDLKIKVDPSSWKLMSHNGYYYVGNQEEFFLFANPKSVSFTPQKSQIEIDIPKQGAPVIVKSGDKYLTQVSFLDSENNFSIENTEVLENHYESNKYYLSYENAINIRVNESSSGFTFVPPNIIETLSSHSEPITVKYKVKDSFVVVPGENKATVILSEPMSNTTVYYEGSDETSYFPIENVDLSPIVNHISEGFVYLTKDKEQPAILSARCHPDILSANGIDVATIVVDVQDIWENPVLGHTVSCSITQGGGSISSPVEHYNRRIFRYTAPSGIASSRDAKLIFSVQVDGGETISSEVTIKLIKERE